MDYILDTRHFVGPGDMEIIKRDKVPVFMVFISVVEKYEKIDKCCFHFKCILSLTASLLYTSILLCFSLGYFLPDFLSSESAPLPSSNFKQKSLKELSLLLSPLSSLCSLSYCILNLNPVG